jgi:hypothetical protein
MQHHYYPAMSASVASPQNQDVQLGSALRVAVVRLGRNLWFGRVLETIDANERAVLEKAAPILDRLSSS